MTDQPADDAPPPDHAPVPVGDVDAITTSADAPPDVGAEPPAAADPGIDLDAIERELAAVEAALDRLSSGTYWTDEVTGEPLPDELLAEDPTARRATTA